MRTVDLERTTERRRQILDAALFCFREEGFHGAGMASICRRAHMSPGHLYHYFRSKLELIEAIVEEDSERVERDLREIVDSPNPIESMIEGVGSIWCSDNAIKGALNADILAEATRNKRVAEILRRRDARVRQSLVDALSVARERGQMVDGIDLQGFASIIMAMIQGLTASFDAGTGIDVETTTEAVRTMLRRSLQA